MGPAGRSYGYAWCPEHQRPYGGPHIGPANQGAQPRARPAEKKLPEDRQGPGAGVVPGDVGIQDRARRRTAQYDEQGRPLQLLPIIAILVGARVTGHGRGEQQRAQKPADGGSDRAPDERLFEPGALSIVDRSWQGLRRAEP
jgi:hypothetical protein